MGNEEARTLSSSLVSSICPQTSGEVRDRRLEKQSRQTRASPHTILFGAILLFLRKGTCKKVESERGPWHHQDCHPQSHKVATHHPGRFFKPFICFISYFLARIGSRMQRKIAAAQHSVSECKRGNTMDAKKLGWLITSSALHPRVRAVEQLEKRSGI